MENVLWNLVNEQAAYINRLESLIVALQDDVQSVRDMADGMDAKIIGQLGALF